ncbi:hypothetical protein TNIN_231801, partial [Trichonephila inaurata madagascariensis]
MIKKGRSELETFLRTRILPVILASVLLGDDDKSHRIMIYSGVAAAAFLVLVTLSGGIGLYCFR